MVFLQVIILDNSSLRIYDKIEEKAYRDIKLWDDTGDIGIEYIFKQVKKD